MGHHNYIKGLFIVSKNKFTQLCNKSCQLVWKDVNKPQKSLTDVYCLDTEQQYKHTKSAHSLLQLK